MPLPLTHPMCGLYSSSSSSSIRLSVVDDFIINNCIGMLIQVEDMPKVIILNGDKLEVVKKLPR